MIVVAIIHKYFDRSTFYVLSFVI